MKPQEAAEYIGIIELTNGYFTIMKSGEGYFIADVCNAGYRRTSDYFETLQDVYDHIESTID